MPNLSLKQTYGRRVWSVAEAENYERYPNNEPYFRLSNAYNEYNVIGLNSHLGWVRWP